MDLHIMQMFANSDSLAHYLPAATAQTQQVPPQRCCVGPELYLIHDLAVHEPGLCGRIVADDAFGCLPIGHDDGRSLQHTNMC